MKYFGFLSILHILLVFTEQHLVVLTPDKQEKPSHELLQTDPVAKIEVTGSNELSGEKDSKESEEVKLLMNTEEVLKDDEGNSDSESEDQEGMVFLFQVPYKFRGKMPIDFDENDKTTHWKRWLSEIASGDPSVISGTNPKTYQPVEYPHLMRPHVPKLNYPQLLIGKRE